MAVDRRRPREREWEEAGLVSGRRRLDACDSLVVSMWGDRGSTYSRGTREHHGEIVQE